MLSDPRKSLFLMAISLGAVFFGACTYIGNGPNFMVKSIAEHAGARCSSFFGYILCYTLPVLLPVFILIWALFLRGPP
jgi:Na+/H+ antiporter NhaD/arsenite permease-like protein